MRKNYKKTLLGSIIAFIVGTSCCWISSLAIWIGGATVLTVVSNYLENIQIFLFTLGIVLGLVTLYLYRMKL